MTITYFDKEQATDEYTYPNGNPDRDEARAIQRMSSNEVMREFFSEAEGNVCGSRQDSYGNPEDNHTCTAALWSAWLSRRFRRKIELTGSDICWLMTFQKGSREANCHKRDNAIDGAGYLANSIACHAAANASDLYQAARESVHSSLKV